MYRAQALIRGLVLAALSLVTITGSAADSKPLTIKIRVLTCFSPCDTRVDVHLERHPANVLFRIRVTGENFERYSEIAMERHPVRFELWYYALPAGEYQVAADLVRHGLRDPNDPESPTQTWVEGPVALKLVVIETRP